MLNTPAQLSLRANLLHLDGLICSFVDDTTQS